MLVPVEHHNYLDFNLEVLNGCKWSCDGCHVNKTIQDGFVGTDIDKFLGLIQDFKSRGYVPTILTVGPTDVLTANNSLNLFTDQRFRDLATQFKRVAFLTTFLSPGNSSLIGAINDLNVDEVEFAIALEPAQFTNQKYISTVRDNMNLVKNSIKTRCVIHLNFNLFDYTTLKTGKLLQNYKLINDLAYEYFHRGVDYAVPFSRNSTIDPEDTTKLLLWLRDMFNAYVTPESATQVHFDAGNFHDSLGKSYTYRNGEFYFSPLMYERFVSFDPSLKIPVKDWTANEFEKFERNLLVQQYAGIGNKPCSSCTYAPICINRGVLHVMDMLGTNECLAPKEAYKIINGVTY